MAYTGRKMSKTTKNVEGSGRNKVEVIIGRGFGQQKLELYEIIVSSNGDEGGVLRELKVAGTENSARNYLRVLAREYSDERFRWSSEKKAYCSPSFTLLFDRIKKIEGSLDAILLPVD